MKTKKQLSQVIWHKISAEKTTSILGSDRKKGIIQESEVSFRRKNYGKNKIVKDHRFSLLKTFFSQFNSPLILILILAIIATFLMKEYTDSLVIGLAVIINAVFGFWEEVKVSKVFNKLHSALKTVATVVRAGQKKEILQEELVVGDLISLRAGDKIPADGRVVQSEGLQVSEAILTGESEVSKKIIEKLPSKTHLADRENMVYMGSSVEKGKGFALVTAVGKSTEIGRVADLLKSTKELKSPLQKKIVEFGKLIGAIILGLVGVLFIGGLWRGENPLKIFEASVAIVVGGVPESLPVVVTVILAIGMERLLRKKGLVRKMNSVETLGSASVICLDKTKTLTQGKMRLKKLEAVKENLAYKIGIICNEAYIENPEENPGNWKVNGSPTDKALFFMGAKQKKFKSNFAGKYQELLKLPFDFHHKFQASLIKEKEKLFIYVTGAPEKLLELSKQQKDWQEKSEKLAQEGLRIVGLAYKEIKQKPKNPEELLREIKDLEFVGLAGLRDPLRKEIKKAIHKAQKAGIRPVIITGDQTKTALFVAKEAGLNIDASQVLSGQNLDGMSESQLKKTVHNFQIYTRSEPRHKIRIVNAWQANGRVVAMVGDGVNDAPAIKKADIGIAVGSGTEIAQEASDLVLLNDSFDIIIEAIAEGRTILNNLRKSIAYVLSDSFASILVVGIAKIAFGWPLPILPVQILWNNFIEDSFPTIAYAFDPPEKGVMKTKAREVSKDLLNKEMKILIFFTGIIEQLIILVAFWVFWRKLGWDLDYVRTLMFGFFALDTAFVIYAFKDLNRSIWQTNLFNNKWLNGSSIFVILTFLMTIYIPFFQNLIKTVPIDLKGWVILFGIVVVNISLIEITKYIFIVKRKK